VDAAITALLDAHHHQRRGHLALVVELSGFGLRDLGEAAVISDGTVTGRLLGGLADGELQRAADTGGRTVRTSITDRSAEGAGLVCGGVARLVLVPVDDLPAELFSWLAEARAVGLAVSLDEGAGVLAVTGRSVAGTLGAPALDEEVTAVARQLLERGRSDRRVTEVDDRPVLVVATVPRPRLVVVGAGPMADAIDAQGRLLGWSCETTEDVGRAVGFVADAGPGDAVVVLSHDPALDAPVLAAAVGGGIGYVGAMGSRATQSARRSRLDRLGVPAERQSRIHGPVGLDLGARTPAETAVAIVAEVLAARSGRAPGSLRGATGPINR
jgi:xanthine dehydrogenase accessory factor